MTRPILLVVSSSVLWASGITPSAYSLITTTLAPSGVARRQTLNFALSPGVVCADNAGTKATDCEFQFVDLVSDQTAAGIKTWTSRGNYGLPGSNNKGMSLYPNYDGSNTKALVIGFNADVANQAPAVVVQGGGSSPDTYSQWAKIAMNYYDPGFTYRPQVEINSGSVNYGIRIRHQYGSGPGDPDYDSNTQNNIIFIGENDFPNCQFTPVSTCFNSPTIAMYRSSSVDQSVNFYPFFLAKLNDSLSSVAFGGNVGVYQTDVDPNTIDGVRGLVVWEVGNMKMRYHDENMYNPSDPLVTGGTNQGFTGELFFSAECSLPIVMGLVSVFGQPSSLGLNNWYTNGCAASFLRSSSGLTVSGAVPFASATADDLSSDPTQFFWDATNNRLGIGNAAPTVSLDVTGSAAISGTTNAPAFVSSGSTFSISGCSATSATGGATAGRFTSGTTGTCTVTVTMGSSMSSTNGWSCSISNQTTANLTRQTASTSTTATFSGVAVTSDVYAFACVGN